MKKLILLTVFLTSFLFPQLKEMEVKLTENQGGIPIFRDYPDKGGIIFYTQYDNLTFYSIYGIHQVMGDPASGKYVVIIEPAKQSIEIRSPGHKSEIIKIESLQPRDVLYYEVSPKKEEEIQSITEVGITVQVTQSDAEIMIDGKKFPHNRTKKLSIGKHRLKVGKKYYVTYDEDIEVSTGMTLFQVKLKYDIASTMVKIDGSTFMMGSNQVYDQAKPVHKVTLSSFLISKYEVTQELWESVMGNNPSEFKGVKSPVETVNWYDVVEFCNKLSVKEWLTPAYKIDKTQEDPNNTSSYDKLKWIVTCDFNSNGYRLPTEAEWEYAARGGEKSKGYTYSGSYDIDVVAWYTNNSGSTTHDVGTKQPNELGLYDMSGNVWEWCWDWKGKYTSVNQTDPRGPNSGTHRVLRGCCWGKTEVSCRVAHRNDEDPDYRSNNNGFRLVRTK